MCMYLYVKINDFYFIMSTVLDICYLVKYISVPVSS